ncbi:putative GAF sensor protein [Mycolicibacterium canariasense]|uniref:Putative GAF sensor protein n=1 Tax=Mycolicibacterium canariasense TaxID=228230 RepID=A0A100WGC0_MYCCR|nr:GAF domain-containing protein [Mycolicibacterium canariasense]MCV7210748.1 GAF domain-containing protein [Mycolicibacterium canariasense]ORU98337.1 histidine kinase [Mycolicibacterium canariasense]GAS97483.1 putative GAF sensor protein [Mycolicibacterium canariasense]
MAQNAMAQIELQALQKIARVMASSQDLGMVLQLIAEAIAGDRSDRDVYIYVFDADTNELVLTGATESPAARQVGILRVAYGAGVTGWVAASRQSYLVADKPGNDPHFLAYPDIGEERYGAIFSVPIVSREDDLLGCITVWATSGHRFDAAEVPFVERVSALVAGTFETALLLETHRHQTRVSDGLGELASMVASGTPTAPTLEFATELARIAVRADIAVSLVTDPSGADRMYLAVPSPNEPHPRGLAQTARKILLDIEQDIRNGRLSWHGATEKVGRALDRIAGAVVTAPVRVGSDDLGMVACYRIEASRFTTQEAATVTTIANHAAMALKLALLSDELSERNSLNWFLRDLSSGRVGADELRRRAAAIGIDAGTGYVFVVGSVAAQSVSGVDVGSLSLGSSLKDLLTQIQELPVDTHWAITPYQTVAVIPWTGDEDSIDALRLPLLEVCARVRASTGTALTFGVSRPVAALDDFCGALAEAREAMAIGASLSNPSGVFTLDDVGHHLLLSRVSGVGSVRDRYATAIARIAEYDRVKGTELLETLAVFLHFRSQSAASRELFVHRNTLNQRLTRATSLSGFDVLDSSEWFPLQLALKVHQARVGVTPIDRRNSTENRRIR